MMPRFVQLFLLASLILLVPSLLYLSHGPSGSFIDPKTGLVYSSDSILAGTNPLSQTNPLAQTSQGDGVDPQQTPHRWSGWTWQDLNNGIIKKPVEKAEDTWKGLMDSWKGAKDGGNRASSPPQSPGSDQTGAIGSPAIAGAASAPKKTEERIEGVIMPKMANATAKAALGRSTWHFLHTMTLRFPDKPTPEQRATLQSFFQNFALLYPCGDCAKHFQALIKELPPQTGSRMSASLWLCSVHNLVNKRLGKPEFPCDKLDESYDCGCGPEKPEAGGASSEAASGKAATTTLSVAELAAVAAAKAKANDGTTPFLKVRRDRDWERKRIDEGVHALVRRVLDLSSPKVATGIQRADLGKRMIDDAAAECRCQA